MASQNNPPSDDPLKTIGDMLKIVEDLRRPRSPEIYSRRYRSPIAELKPESIKDEERYDADPNDVEMLSRLDHHLQQLNHRLLKLQNLREDVHEELLEHHRPLKSLLERATSSSSSSRFSREMKSDVEGITRNISDLVGQIPLLHDKRVRLKAFYFHDSHGYNMERVCDFLPSLHTNVEDLIKREAFRQVKQKFMELTIERKMCLLSFGVFPENRGVHRTMLKYWWIGEEIFLVEGAEKNVREVLEEFTEKKLVEPVEERRKVAPSSYKMTPFVHSSVVHLSQEIGLFDIYHKGKKPRMQISKMGKVCLVEGSSNQAEALPRNMPSQNIETVFNVSERYPEFTFKWFLEDLSNRKLIRRLSKPLFKSLLVFYLGRWERTQKRHIELRSLEFMRCLKFMKNLRVLSFQGISTIRNLNSSVCELHKLIVLDLRECSDLTKLPGKMSSLQSLVYLDMTGCYMLEWIPLKLALLKNLVVLKGFVVSDEIYWEVACTLNLLKELKKLRKLSIEIHRDDLGVHQLMVDIVQLRALTSLKVTWRRDLNIDRAHAGKPKDSKNITSLPEQLKKLDLQRFPHEQLPIYLYPENLIHLEKFHIGGARLLKGFGGDLPKKATKCGVKVLRLTSLPKLRVGWIKLKQIYFPNLTFLEKYECPRVTLTPCDGNGIWRSDQD